MQPLFSRVSISSYLILAITWGMGIFSDPSDCYADDKLPNKIASVEGLSEYVLENGLKILLFPDRSQPKLTFNSTVFVGSKHEGVGESGMAHLLERMLFKETDLHPRIHDALTHRGATFNGSTWHDRTSFTETLNASDDNLEFAIQLEADRLVNSKLQNDALQKEIGVVRSELDKLDSNPVQALQQTTFSTAFQWHTYNKPIYGKRGDIERMTVDSLSAFYRKHYRPDNAMLIIAGSFDETKALGLIRKYFGAIEKPTVTLSPSYTVEPPQEGERMTVVRRVGSVQLVGCMYHIPCSADPEFVAMELLSSILADGPNSRLYRSLVTTKKATSVFGRAFRFRDPGAMYFFTEIPIEKSLEDAQGILLNEIENIAASPITTEEVERAKQQIINAREMTASKTESFAASLSEWASQGDWRLYFINRDCMDKVTSEQVQQIALKYLVRSNRTLGVVHPTEKSERIDVANGPNVAAIVQDYAGREAITEGEPFNPTPKKIEERLIRGELKTGIPFAFLPKKTRGSTVNLILNLRFGDEKSLMGKAVACQMLGRLMERGTKSLDVQQLNDRKEKLKSTISIKSKPQLLEVSLETKRDKLVEAIELLQDILRNPGLDENELSLLKEQMLKQLENQKRDPEVLTVKAVNRVLNPYKRGDVRYVSTVEEELDDYRNLKLSDIKDIHGRFLSGTEGELAIVGDFETKEVEEKLSAALANWKSKIAYQRIATAATTDIKIPIQFIDVPEKSNCSFFASQQYAIRDDHPKYPALIVSNNILGGGGPNSRLANRISHDEGLSQGITSMILDSQIDECATLSITAATVPASRDKLIKAIDEEIRKLVKEGVLDKELKDNIQSFLQNRRLARSRDAELAGILAKNLFAGRTMEYYEKMEADVARLTVEDVNEAISEYISPDRFVIATAGDFAKLTAPKP